MAYSKSSRANYALTTQLVTVKEMNAVSEFIKEFKLRYSRKKKAAKKK